MHQKDRVDRQAVGVAQGDILLVAQRPVRAAFIVSAAGYADDASTPSMAAKIVEREIEQFLRIDPVAPLRMNRAAQKLAGRALVAMQRLHFVGGQPCVAPSGSSDALCVDDADHFTVTLGNKLTFREVRQAAADLRGRTPQLRGQCGFLDPEQGRQVLIRR